MSEIRQSSHVIGTEGLAIRRDQTRIDEDEHIGLDGLFAGASEESSDDRNAAQERNLVIKVLNLLLDEAAENHGLAIPDDQFCLGGALGDDRH